MAREDRALRSGERIAGTNYVVIQYESGGGHGSLYRVRHHELEKRIYALKLLHANLRANTDLAVRMKREAQILSAMCHPNIVQVHDAGTTQEVDPDTQQTLARPFLAMDWLKGRSLASILAGVHGMGIGLHDSLEIGIEVADALDYAHTKHGVIHRDIKPDNVFLQAAGSVHGKTITRLLDFGVAAVLGAEKITQRPTILGTPRYASPEQLRGETPTPQTDLYGMGLLLYEMLVGFGPFDDYHGLKEMMRAHLTQTAAPLPSRDFPDPIVRLVAACLEKKAENRPRGAGEVSRYLREIKFRAEERRAKNLAALSKTDPMPVAAAIIPAGLEATDPGGATGVDFAAAPDSTAPGASPVFRSPELPQTVSRHLGVIETQVEDLPFGAQMASVVTRKNPELLVETAASPSAASLIDRLAVTQTSPPFTPRQRTESMSLPQAPPPPFIGGVPVYQMGDRYVMDPERAAPPPAAGHPVTPAYASPHAERITPPAMAPPRLVPASVITTTTNGGAMSLSAHDLPQLPRRSFRSALRLPVPAHYAVIVGGVGFLGVLLIVLLSTLRVQALGRHPASAPPTGAPVVTPPAISAATLPTPAAAAAPVVTAPTASPAASLTAAPTPPSQAPTVATARPATQPARAPSLPARTPPKPAYGAETGEFRTSFQ